MKRSVQKYYRIIAIVSILAIAGISFLFQHTHEEALSLVTEQFNEQQMLLARGTAIGINENVNMLVKELELLSSMPSIENLDIEKSREIIEQSFEHVKNLYVNDIALIDSRGIVRLPLKAPHLTGADFSYRGYFRQARMSTASAPVYEFIAFRGVDVGEKGIAIAMPIFLRDGEFGGVVLFTIKVSELIKGFAPPQTANTRSWVIDAEGNVLYHPGYKPGTVIDKLPDLDASFKIFIENIKEGREHKAEYISPEGTKTLAVSYPVEIADQKWLVVVAASKETIESLLVHFTSEYALGISIALLAIIGSALGIIYLVNRWNLELQQDITRREQSEEALRAAEEKYHSIFNEARDGIVLIDRDTGSIADCNPEFESQTGRGLEELRGMKIWEIRPPEKIEAARKKFFEIKESDAGGSSALEFQKPNGEVVPIEFTGKAVNIHDKSYIQSISRDITERKRAEEEITRLASYPELNPNPVIEMDLEGNIHYRNPAARDMPGLDKSGTTHPFLAGMQIVPEALRDREEKYVVREIEIDDAWYEQTIHLVPESNRIRIYVRRITERKRAEEELNRYREHLEELVKERTAELITAFDALEAEIAEREKTEAQLLQSRKMEAVGQLAGGIAHDFNNRLFAIRNYAHILKTKGDEQAADIADGIFSSCNKAARLIDELMQFSRKKAINPRPVDLNNIVREAEDLLRVALGKNIKLDLQLADEQLTVIADNVQMEHVLINLATNAKGAMPEGGRLTIRTERVGADAAPAGVFDGGKQSVYALVSVTDTGPGMDERTRGKIFEPFFTTKEAGEGTGLGLSIVYSTVKQHGGYIEVQSEPGKGATFKIYLPMI